MCARAQPHKNQKPSYVHLYLHQRTHTSAPSTPPLPAHLRSLSSTSAILCIGKGTPWNPTLLTESLKAERQGGTGALSGTNSEI